MNIDPALRAASGSQTSYGQQLRSPQSYPEVSPQATGYEVHQQSSHNTPAVHGQSRQSQYYGMPTPNSYPSGGVQSHESPFDTSPTSLHQSDPNDLKRSRACEACRQLKVRCEPDESNELGSCKRCAKANRTCIVTAPSRKRQKKTDSRVAELEKKIDALTASLMARGGSENDSALDPAITEPQVADMHDPRNLYEERRWPSQSGEDLSRISPTMKKEGPGTKRKLGQDYHYSGGAVTKTDDQPYNKAKPGTPVDSTAVKNTMPQVPVFQAMFNTDGGKKESNDWQYVDVIDRQLIDEKTAYRIFDRFHKETCKYLPGVVFPPETTGEEIRRSKPLLFLAILGASSNTLRPDLQNSFVTETTRILSERVIFRGEKSMELLQAILVLSSFYLPPERYEELNFSQIIHMGAVMALDIGMGKRAKAGGFAMWREFVDRKSPLPDANAPETRRTWLACYYMCANAAMSLRRPPLLRWSAYTEECVEILSTSPDALPSDKWICDLARVQHIAEDVGFQFSLDDPAATVSITDAKTQHHLKAFERQLDEWRSRATKDMPKHFIELIYSTINLYMHEIAIHNDHNVDDFKHAPFAISDDLSSPDDPHSVLTSAHIEYLTACLESIHQTFDSFLALDIKILRGLPTIFIVRNSYAAVALIKMYSAVSANDSRFSTIFRASELKVEYYLDAMINKLNQVGEGNQSLVANKFSFIFNMLKSWHSKRLEGKPPGMKSLAAAFKSAPGQDPNSVTWNAQSVDVNSKRGGAAPQSGLHVLSDAAMGQNTPTTSDSDANAGATAGGQLVAIAPELRYANQSLGSMMSNTPALAPDPSIFYGFLTGTGDADTNYGFTTEELNAMGSLMDDPGWMSFPMEQSPWAF